MAPFHGFGTWTAFTRRKELSGSSFHVSFTHDYRHMHLSCLFFNGFPDMIDGTVKH